MKRSFSFFILYRSIFKSKQHTLKSYSFIYSKHLCSSSEWMKQFVFYEAVVVPNGWFLLFSLCVVASDRGIDKNRYASYRCRSFGFCRPSYRYTAVHLRKP